MTPSSRNGNGRHEFDKDQPTGEILRVEALPRLARHAKALKTLAGAVVAVFLAGAGYEACRVRYQTTAAAIEDRSREDGVHSAMQKAIDDNARHLAEHDGEFKAAREWRDEQRQREQKMEDYVIGIARHFGVGPEKHGAQP